MPRGCGGMLGFGRERFMGGLCPELVGTLGTQLSLRIRKKISTHIMACHSRVSGICTWRLLYALLYL